MKYLFSLAFLFSLSFAVAQQATPFAACNPKAVCAVDDFMLTQAKGKMTLPDVKPEYETGNTGLLAYFAENEYPSSQPFTVSIGFLINCKAQAGNYQILTKHSVENQFLAELILAQVKEIPSKWMPGKVKNRFVDCYEVLQIMIQEGKVVKVGLK